MGQDRFVYWTSEERPTFEQIRHVAEDFFGLDATVRTAPPRVLAKLGGFCSEPLCRSGRITDAAAHRFDDDTPRKIEVYVAANHIDVITRQSDPFTNALADRLAAEFMRGWPASREDPSLPQPAVTVGDTFDHSVLCFGAFEVTAEIEAGCWQLTGEHHTCGATTEELQDQSGPWKRCEVRRRKG